MVLFLKKYNILLIVFILLMMKPELFSQENASDSIRGNSKPVKRIIHEIGVNVFYYKKYPGPFPLTNPPKYISAFDTYNIKSNFIGRSNSFIPYISGILYKLHINKNIFRFHFDYYKYNYKRDSTIYGNLWFREAGDYSSAEIKFGYQRFMANSKIKPYISFDFTYKYSEYDNWWTINHRRDGTYDEDRINYYGISPAGGLNLTINNLSVNLETSIDFMYYKKRNNFTGGKGEGMMTYFNLVRLFSVNIYF